MLNFMNSYGCTMKKETLVEKSLKENNIQAIIINNSFSFNENLKVCEEDSNLQEVLENTNESNCNCCLSSNSATCSSESSLFNFNDCECEVFEDVKSSNASNQERNLEDLKKQDIEFTLAVLKPEAFYLHLDIERQIRNNGFQILQTRCLQLTPEQAAEFYKDYDKAVEFACIIKHITSGPIIVMVLAKHAAIDNWKQLIGPKKLSEARSYSPDSLRAKYGNDDIKNAVHGSENHEEAEREINFFFPDFIIEPVLKDKNIELYLWEKVIPVLSEAVIQCCKSKPSDPILWLANWLITNNPNKPKLSESTTLGAM